MPPPDNPKWVNPVSGLYFAGSSTVEANVTSLRSPEYQEFVSRLIDARKKIGITQAELAEQLGKPQSFVSKYERFERRLDVVEYVRIASQLDIDPYEIFYLTKG